MELESLLGLLGLARRAGKLAAGEALTAELVAAGRARAVFVAEDAGETTRRRALRHDARVPVFRLPCPKEQLGSAIGVAGCAVCALSDIGLAAAAAKKLADDETNRQAAARVAEKKTRIESRRGRKK